jgi:hypothetical protein
MVVASLNGRLSQAPVYRAARPIRSIPYVLARIVAIPRSDFNCRLKRHHHSIWRNAIMTCNAEISRMFPSYRSAYDYLTSRGFFCLPRGWANGRWSASVETAGRQVHVLVRLRAA